MNVIQQSNHGIEKNENEHTKKGNTYTEMSDWMPSKNYHISGRVIDNSEKLIFAFRMGSNKEFNYRLLSFEVDKRTKIQPLLACFATQSVFHANIMINHHFLS